MNTIWLQDQDTMPKKSENDQSPCKNSALRMYLPDGLILRLMSEVCVHLSCYILKPVLSIGLVQRITIYWENLSGKWPYLGCLASNVALKVYSHHVQDMDSYKVFATVLDTEEDAPDIIWNMDMRQRLVDHLTSELEPYVRARSSDPMALYVHTRRAPLYYPELAGKFADIWKGFEAVQWSAIAYYRRLYCHKKAHTSKMDSHYEHFNSH